jgi:dTDP-4-dehydrorhamnose 3,5-epimerase
MIDGVIVKDLTLHQDDRGYLVELWRESWGVMPQLRQVYMVGDDAAGIRRAWHKHAELHDLFLIVRGAAKFGLHDDRKDSPTYKETQEVVLTERKPQALWVPPGVYHGWNSLLPATLLLSLASHEYNHEKPDEERIPWDAIKFFWGVKYK